MKVNLGSGPLKGQDSWLNIDSLEGADIKADIAEGIPLKDGSVEMLYSSHFLEHLEYRQVCRTLLECHRVLAVGGVISLCLPNARRYIDDYLNNSSNLNGSRRIIYLPDATQLEAPSFLSAVEWTLSAKALVNTCSPIDWVNYIAYSNGDHKYMFDEVNIVSHLDMAGFSASCIRAFDPVIDDQSRRAESLYAQAIKSN